MLYSAAQRPATQQKRIHVERCRSERVQHRSHIAVVAKAVRGCDGDALQGARIQLGLQLRLAAPDGRGVELIGALRELRNSGQHFRPELLDGDPKIELGNQIFQAPGLAQDLIAGFLLLIALATLLILGRHLRPIEGPEVLQGRKNL